MAELNFNQVRRCETDRNQFCYLCSKYLPQNKKKSKKTYSINSSKTRQLVLKCFPNFVFAGTASNFAPESCCSKCIAALNRASTSQSRLPYEWPAIWRRPSSDHSDCYFCLTQLHPFNRVHESSFSYPERSCLTKPRPLPSGEPAANVANSAGQLEPVANQVDPANHPDHQAPNLDDSFKFDASDPSESPPSRRQGFDESFRTGSSH